MNYTTLTLGILASVLSWAAPNCDTNPAEKDKAWMEESAFKERLLGEGYKVKVFKKSGNCYELYGWTREGEKVEIYFNPKSGIPVKTVKK